MKLSSRQRDFLSRLLDLYREAEHAVHYTDVAQALDVSPVTAYEMLRLLEEKELARSEMVRPEGHRGRSIVVFFPTQEAMALLAQWGGALSEQEWEQAEADILEALEKEKATDYQDLLNQLLQRIPERKSPLLFAADIITVIILLLYELRRTALARQIVSNLRWFGPPAWRLLYSLAGLGLALSLVERANRRGTALLLSQSRQFHEYLDNLTGEDKRRLSDFAREVLQTVGLWEGEEGDVSAMWRYLASGT
ncbi:MAG: hypothetical protein ACP5HG_11450 [Anaerolineae bacterium]